MSVMGTKFTGTRRIRVGAALLTGAILLATTPALGAGMWNLEQGASHYARGGANLADPGDPSAVFTNPAALAALDGLQFLLGANVVFDERTFARSSDLLGPGDSEREFDSVTNEEPAGPSPNIFLAYNLGALGLEEMTIGFGLWGPPKTHRMYDELGAQRYSSVTTRDLQAHYLFSVGYELPFQKFRLGASFGGTSTLVNSSLRLNVYETRKALAPDREDPEFDILANITGEEHGIPTAILSTSLELWANSTFSISYQMPFDVSAPGKADLKMQGFLEALAVVTGDDITINLSLPPVIRTGLRHDFDSGSVELAYAWEGWKRTEKIEIVPDGISIASAGQEPRDLDTITIETRLRDTYSFRLGGDYQAMPELLLLRAGTYYERAAIGPKRLNASQFDLDKVGVTAGARVELGAGLYLDVALGYVHWMPVTVDDSKVMFSDPAPPEPETAESWPIGNGTYSNTQIFTMAALGGQFDI